MEFTVNKTAFSEALSLVTMVVPERSARAILQNLMLTGNEDGTITLAATDLEIGIKLGLEVVNMKEPTSVLLPASRLRWSRAPMPMKFRLVFPIIKRN